MEKNEIGELSMLVNGLSFSSLDEGSIKNALRKLDAQLEENTASLQESWGQFVDVCNTIAKDRNPDTSVWLNSKDAVDLLTSPNITQTSACSYEPIVLNCFLNNVIQALERNSGQEESIFYDLVQFASHQGILMPFGRPERTDSSQDEHTLNTIVIESENATDVLWEAIRSKLRKGMWMILSNIPFPDEDRLALCHQRKLNLLYSLCFLYPAEEIWKGYKDYRQKLMDQYVRDKSLLKDVKIGLLIPRENELSGDVLSFLKLCRASEIMIFEDATILQEGLFPEKVPSFEFLHGLYLERITQELHSVCESCGLNKSFQDERLLNEGSRQPSSRRGSLISIGRQSGEERQPGNRRGSSTPSVKHNDLKQNVSALSLCFSSAVALEMVAQRITSQRSDNEGTGSSVGNLQSSMRRPVSPVLGHKSPSRQSSKKNTTQLYVAEGNLPLPLGSGASRPDSPSSSSLCNLSQSQMLQWPWRDKFKSHISKISVCISESMKQIYEKALDDEIQAYKALKRIPVVKLKDDIFRGKQDYPKRISKCCAVVMEKADEFLPLASSYGGKLFQVVRSSFVDSLEACLKSYHARLTQVQLDVPKLCNLDCLYAILSSAVFVKNHLVYYEDVLGSEQRHPFPMLLHQFSELVDSVSDQITSYHDNAMCTVILQDAHSHNWTEKRPFFEDERCSFSVQMWNFHLQGLCQDLWYYCPPEKAQHLFSSILHNSLVTLTTRYGRATPSSRRIKQFRSDITAILLCTLSFLWSCCDSVRCLLDSRCAIPPFAAIHTLCSCLLTTLTVVTCPLETLCSHVLDEGSSNEDTTNSATAWLSWLCPEVFKSHEGRLAALTDRQATFVLYKLVVNQPSPKWPLFLQALLSRNARLPVTIVKYGDLSALRSPLHAAESTDNVVFSWYEEESSSSEGSSNKFSEGVVCSLYHILFQCSNKSPGLVNFLMAMVSREDSWKLFESASSGLKISDGHDSPVWLDCMYKTFEPYIVRFLHPSLLLLCEQDKKVTKTYNFTSMSALPCGCPRKKSPKTRETKSLTDALYSSLQELLKQMNTHFCAIPKIMCQFLNKLQESVDQKSTDLSSEAAGIKVLASLLFRWLMDIDRVCSVCDAKLSPETQRSIAMFGEVVWHVLVHLGRTEGGVRNPNLPSDIDALLISKRDWLNRKVGQIKAQIASQAYEEYPVETVYDSVAEQQFAHMASALLTDGKGASSLHQAYNFIQANKDWLMNLVLVPGHILPPQPPRSTQVSKQHTLFNPLKQFSMIGEYAFSQDKISSFPFEWSKLLQSGLCSSVETVKRLAFNRSEMQEGALSEDNEIELVNALKGHYGVSVGSGSREQSR